MDHWELSKIISIADCGSGNSESEDLAAHSDANKGCLAERGQVGADRFSYVNDQLLEQLLAALIIEIDVNVQLVDILPVLFGFGVIGGDLVHFRQLAAQPGSVDQRLVADSRTHGISPVVLMSLIEGLGEERARDRPECDSVDCRFVVGLVIVGRYETCRFQHIPCVPIPSAFAAVLIPSPAELVQDRLDLLEGNASGQ
ncbi:hypothetical protein OIE68_40140 [Nocardia vinacea]|uniref:hypothetical protein n=1 Tax=Nocardia vinacea TaxID=96468 RepID=UPI002E0D3B55|nr:hypothetical protein OIE68_40140 [Nocardia vinacea]